MYKNLEELTLEKGIEVFEINSFLGKNIIGGDEVQELSFEEAVKIKESFFSQYSIMYLFEKKEVESI